MVQDDRNCCCHTKPHLNLTYCRGLGPHLTFLLETTTTLLTASTILWCGHQPWTQWSQPSCPEPPSPGIDFHEEQRRAICNAWSTQMASPLCRERSPFSGLSELKMFIDDIIYSPSSPSQRSTATGTLRMFFFFLIAGKLQDFCAHAWFPYPPSAWSRAVWGLPTH